MSWFPLITRSHHEDALNVRDEEIARLKVEIHDLQEERKRLMDVITLKSVGFQMYGTIQLPKDEEEVEERPQSPEKDSAEPIAAKREELPATRARDVVRRSERENLIAAENERRENARLMKMAQDAVKEQVQREIEEAKRNGYKAAEAASNGKGPH